MPTATTAMLGNILSNDKLGDGTTATSSAVSIDLDPSTPAIDQSYTVIGEGTWIVNPTTGQASFTPIASFKLDPTPIIYKLTELATGKSDTAKLIAEYVPLAVNDVVGFANDTVNIYVLLNDNAGDIVVPSTVKLIDPISGNPVNSVIVAGEGTWTVNPVNGVVTFSPVVGFTGIPSSLDYQVQDNDGNKTIAKILFDTTPPIASDNIGNYQVDTPKTINVVIDDVAGDIPVPSL